MNNYENNGKILEEHFIQLLKNNGFNVIKSLQEENGDFKFLNPVINEFENISLPTQSLPNNWLSENSNFEENDWLALSNFEYMKSTGQNIGNFDTFVFDTIKMAKAISRKNLKPFIYTTVRGKFVNIDYDVDYIKFVKQNLFKADFLINTTNRFLRKNKIFEFIIRVNFEKEDNEKFLEYLKSYRNSFDTIENFNCRSCRCMSPDTFEAVQYIEIYGDLINKERV